MTLISSLNYNDSSYLFISPTSVLVIYLLNTSNVNTVPIYFLRMKKKIHKDLVNGKSSLPSQPVLLRPTSQTNVIQRINGEQWTQTTKAEIPAH